MEIAVMGIDPGITGGFAAICSTHILVDDLPVLTEANGKRKEKALDANELYKKVCAFRDMPPQLRALGVRTVVYVERTHAMKDSAMTAFSMGQSRGIILAVLAIAGVSFVQVDPQKWKKFHGLIGCDKDASRTLAIQKYPQMREFLERKKDHNRAEALLIADYGFHMENR